VPVDVETFAEQLAQVARERIRALLREQGTRFALEGEAHAKALATTRLRVRTGRLRNSIAGAVRGDEGSGTVDVVVSAGGRVRGGQPVRYAAMQEYGGIQRPRRAKYLRIPLPPAQTAAGVDKFLFPPSLYESGAGLFVLVRTRTGKLLLKHREKNEFWYVLKRSVRITPHRYMRDTLAHLEQRAPEVLRRALGLELEVSSGT